jgi:ubiquinone/menaquinone biosynthesis C-methylase UbiE
LRIMPLSTANRGAQAGRPDQQNTVDRYFQSQALFWRDIYLKSDVYSVIHQQRRDLALAWVDGLELPAGTPVLEVGCGAGATAVALAGRGLAVQAVDSAPAMLELTRQLAARSGVEDRLGVALGDVQHLDFAASQFSLVVALGVLPWIDSPGAALLEISRVLRPGGYIIANVDNRWRLNRLLDPMLWLRAFAGRLLQRSGLLNRTTPPAVNKHTISRFNSMLRAAGFERMRGIALGFGPFSILGWRFLPYPVGVRFHWILQRLAERNAPVLRATGAQYLVLARKPEHG